MGDMDQNNQFKATTLCGDANVTVVMQVMQLERTKKRKEFREEDKGTVASHRKEDQFKIWYTVLVALQKKNGEQKQLETKLQKCRTIPNGMQKWRLVW